MYAMVNIRAGTYAACTLAREGDDPARLGLGTATMPGGWYLRARITGEPLGLHERIGPAMQALEALAVPADPPDRTQHRDFGAVAAAWGMLEDLGVAGIIDEVTGARRSDAGASAGTYLALAALGRLVAPCSKLAFADWWSGTAAGRFTRIGADVLDHRRFWDAMHAVTLEQMEEISRRIALAIVESSGADCSSVALDMTNFATASIRVMRRRRSRSGGRRSRNAPACGWPGSAWSSLATAGSRSPGTPTPVISPTSPSSPP